jgi:uncharacterized protein YggE
MHASSNSASAMIVTLLIFTSTPKASPAAQPQPAQVAKIEVVGEGRATARPDMARVHLGVVSEAASASEAIESNNRNMEKLVELLDRAGIAEHDIQTVQFSVSPRYRRSRAANQPSEQQIVGYQVTNTVRVTVRALKTLGSLLDEAVRAGSNRIQGISFDSSQRDALVDQARRSAVDDAKHKAQLYAEASGVELGRLLLLSEQPQVSIPRPELFAGARVAAASAVPVAPGELEFHARVYLDYAINQ